MQKDININLAYEKALIVDNNFDIYNKLVDIYRFVFSKYLETKIDLKMYDDKIYNSNLDFGIMPENHKIIYQKKSYLNLKYIYIRNNFYVEKLSVKQINYLYNLDIDNFKLNDELINIIENTYCDVINDNFRKGKYLADSKTCYGLAIPDNIVDSKALTFCIQYGKNTKQYSDYEYLENSKLKKFFLDNLVAEMEMNITKKIGLKTVVLVRNFVGEN